MPLKLIAHLLLIMTLLPCSLQIEARNSLSFTCARDTVKSLQFDQYFDLLKKALDTLEYDFTVRSEPDMRALAMAARGESDGICLRPKHYMEHFSINSLIRIDVAIIHINVQIFSHQQGLSITPSTQLSSHGKTVSFRRGNYWAEHYLKTQEGVTYFDVTESSTGLKLLAARRIDYFVGFEPTITQLMRNEDYQRNIYLSGTLRRVALYAYINKKHKSLVRPLREQLTRLLGPSSIATD